MYNDRDWSNLGRVTVSRGAVTEAPREFDNIYDACRHLGQRIIDDLNDSSHYGNGWAYPVYHSQQFVRPEEARGTTHMVFDDHGLRVPTAVVQHYANITEWPLRYPYCRRHNFVFRQGSVEGISCRRGRYRSCYRGPKTYQEIRENDFVQYDEDCFDYNIEARGARRRGHLPTLWDDVSRAHGGHSPNWKRFRSKQWKGS